MILVVLAILFAPASFLDHVPLSELPLLGTFSSVIGLAMTALFLALRLPQTRLWRGPAKFGIAYLAVTAILQMVQPGATAYFSIYMEYVKPIVLYLILIDVCADPRAAKGMALAFFASVVVMAILAITGLGGLGVADEVTGTGTIRAGVAGLNLNAQAFCYGLALVGGFCWIIASWPRVRLLEQVLLAGEALVLVALLKTGSRSGLVLVVVGLLMGAILTFRKEKVSATLIVAPLILVAVAVAVMSSEVVQARFQQLFAGRETGLREKLAELGWAMFKERPWQGWGVAYTYDLGRALTLDKPMAAHNSYLQIMLSFGIVGFVAWIALGTATLVHAWRCHQGQWGSMLLALFLGTAVFGMAGHLGSDKFFWLLMALVGALSPPRAVSRKRRGARLGNAETRPAPAGRARGMSLAGGLP